MIHALRALTSIIVVILSTGCITTSVKDVAPVTVKPSVVPTVEVTVGDFAFDVDGGKMATSYRAGRKINKRMMESWKDQGLIRGYKEIRPGEFTGSADYEI